MSELVMLCVPSPAAMPLDVFTATLAASLYASCGHMQALGCGETLLRRLGLGRRPRKRRMIYRLMSVRTTSPTWTASKHALTCMMKRRKKLGALYTSWTP